MTREVDAMQREVDSSGLKWMKRDRETQVDGGQGDGPKFMERETRPSTAMLRGRLPGA